MPTSSYGERARAVIPGGVNSGQRQLVGLSDLVITQSAGSRFTDQHGRTYTDYHAAFGPPILGFHDPDVDRAVKGAMSGADLPGVAVTPGEVALAEEIVRLVPGIERVLLTSTGSEATFHALRLARAATGRRLIAKFQGCYHGWHDSVSLNVISAPDRVGRPDPISKGILPEVLQATLVLPFNDVAALRQAFTDHGHDIAAVILEPIPHNVGALIPDLEFLRALREETSKAGSILIFDEVITGLRHALGGYQSIVGITPDLTTLGKALGNGYPVAAIGGRADLMEQFSTTPGAPVFFAGTYNGHPAVVAAAIATLKKLQSEPVHDHIFRLGEKVRNGLRKVFAELGVDAIPSGFGSVFLTYFMPGPPPKTYADLLPNDIGLFVGYRQRMMEHGIFELPLNLKRSHISYAHTDDDVDALLEATQIATSDTLRDRERTTDVTRSSTMGGVQLCCLASNRPPGRQRAPYLRDPDGSIKCQLFHNARYSHYAREVASLSVSSAATPAGSRRIRVGLIGLGDIGVKQHLTALLRSDEYQLVSICDVSEERLSKASTLVKPEVLTTTSAAEVFESGIDAVVIATPPWVTPRLSFAALEFGLTVLAEKPIAVRNEDLATFRTLSAEKSARFQLGLTYRHHPTIQKLRDVFQTGAFGDGPILVRSTSYDEQLDRADRIHFDRIIDALAHGRPHIHEGAHVFDWVAFILGSRYGEVDSAWALKTSSDFPNDNLVGATVRYPGGSVGVYEFGWFLKNLPEGGIQLAGSDLLASITHDMALILQTTGGTQVLFDDLGDRYAVSFDLQLVSFARLVRHEVAEPDVSVADGLAANAIARAIDSRIAEMRA